MDEMLTGLNCGVKAEERHIQLRCNVQVSVHLGNKKHDLRLTFAEAFLEKRFHPEDGAKSAEPAVVDPALPVRGHTGRF